MEFMCYHRNCVLDGWYHTMVVNWTGKPDKEGYWVCAVKTPDASTYHVCLLYVWVNEDGILRASTTDTCFSENSFQLDSLFSDKPLIRFASTTDFIIKCSTTHIQIDNINWDYKYTEGT